MKRGREHEIYINSQNNAFTRFAVNPSVGEMFTHLSLNHDLLTLQEYDHSSNFESERKMFSKNASLVGVVEYSKTTKKDAGCMENPRDPTCRLRYDPLEIIVHDRSHYFRRHSVQVSTNGSTLPISDSKIDRENWLKEETEIRKKSSVLLEKVFKIIDNLYDEGLEPFITKDEEGIGRLFLNLGYLPCVLDIDNIPFETKEGQPTTLAKVINE